MGLNNKKYLDYAGLEKLVDMHAVVPHPQVEITEEGAYKLAFDEHGHIVSKSPLTAGDLKLDKAMHFVGVSTTDPTASTGATVAGHNGSFVAGDVCIYKRSGETGYEEYIYTGNVWELLGDADSYALKSITITSGNEYITGGGDLSENRTLSHKTYTAANAAIKSIGRDSGGHVVIGKDILVQEAGGHDHDHTTSTPIAKDTYVTEAAGNTTKLSINSSKATVLTGIEDKHANLDTTSIRGVSGTTKVSKATAGTEIEVAKIDKEVVYGEADVGREVTVATRSQSTTTVGNANVGNGTSVVADVTVKQTAISQNAYTASYQEADECLCLSPAAITVTPELDITQKNITEAVASTTEIYTVDGTETFNAAAQSTKKIGYAVANGAITSYTFAEVDVATANATATTVATGGVSAGGAGAAIMTGTGITNTEVLNGATIVKGTAGDVDVVDEVTTTKNADVTFAGTTSTHRESAHTHNLYTE
jgi:hypothetical protein